MGGDWWRRKIMVNRERDEDTDGRLVQAGWRVVRVWEHEPPNLVADAIEAVVRGGELREPGSAVRGPE